MGSTVPNPSGRGSNWETTRIPQSEVESLSITGRIVVRPGRTPYASSAAVGGADDSPHSATRSCVVSWVSDSSGSSVGSSSGWMSSQLGTRSSVSCCGSHRRPWSVSLSATTERFTRKTSWSAVVMPCRSWTTGAAPSQSLA